MDLIITFLMGLVVGASGVFIFYKDVVAELLDVKRKLEELKSALRDQALHYERKVSADIENTLEKF